MVMTTTAPLSVSACARSGTDRSASLSSPSSPGCRRTELSLPALPSQKSRPAPTSGSPAEEAAWQILKPFINPIDCNYYINWTTPDGKVLDDVYVMNTNETLNRLFNGEKVLIKYMSKARFFDHCRGNRKYYYRSQWNAAPTSGYGSGKNSHRRLPFSASRYGLDDKKTINKHLGIVLLGFDIDAHNGEKDVEKTTSLVHERFPGAYTEPSTNGKGCHVYLKVVFPVKFKGSRPKTLRYLGIIVEAVRDSIEEDRIKRGYDAPLDLIAGLPTIVGFVEGRIRIVKRSRVIKLPFYKLSGFEAVDRFFDAPWYRIEYLEEIGVSTVAKDEVSYYAIPLDNLLITSTLEATSKAIKTTAKATNTLSFSYPPNRAYPSDALPYNRAYPSLPLTHQNLIEDLKSIDDSRQRRLEFGLLLSRQMGRVPTPFTLKQEYIRSGIYRQTSKSDQDDHRYDQLVELLAKTFDPAKVEFHYRDYPRYRPATESLVLAKTQGIELTWRKGGKIKPVSIAKLAALYWSIGHSQGKADLTIDNCII